MDVTIGHLRLAGRVVGSRDRDPTTGVLDLLTGPAAREHLLTVLTSAFDGEEVIVIRSLACSATLRADARSAPTGLAGSITASAARLLREHPTDDDCVVRFADEASYVAAYVHDCLAGHAQRWYYDAFEPFRRHNGSTDLAALLAAHRALRWRVLTRVRRYGDLDELLDALGDRASDLVAGSADEGAGWSALVATAAAIVGPAVGATVPVDDRTVTALLHAEPPPDWRDATSLGRAVAIATTSLLPSPVGAEDETVDRLLIAARDHDWFDQDAFADGLAARRMPHPGIAEEAVQSVLSPRARQVLTELAAVVSDPSLVLDPRRPTSTANLVRLVTALVDAAPSWEDEDLARAVVAHVLRSWETGGSVGTTASTPPGRPPGGGDAGTQLPASPAGQPPVAQPRAASRPSPAGPVAGAPAPASPVDIARLLEERFPRPGPPGDVWASSAAGGLLLLRALLDLGLSPYLLGRVGHDDEPLLNALLRRWSGGPVGEGPANDPVLSAVLTAAGDPAPIGRLDDACRLALRRLIGLRLVDEPRHAVAVPHGATGVATVVVDGSGRFLPFTGKVADRELPPEDNPDGRAAIADALAAVSVVHDGPEDLLLDLLAVSTLQAWSRWLPGFAQSSVPFLLTTFVRRPASVEVSDSEITVLLPPRSHDVVLELAGYLDPLDAVPALGGRRVRFVTGDSHAT
ncbi:MAG: hypothetical protein ABIQ15_05275 [Nocardioides sp.]